MKLNEIRTFVAVAEAQSVQEAGHRLGLTQSAVSRLIQRLEAELGVSLFDRQTKPLALTRDGELALAHARRVLKASDDLADAFAAAQPRGLLRLGVTHVLMAVAAREPLDRLRAAFPGLTVRLQADWSTSMVEQVRSGALDGGLLLMAEGQTPPADLAGRCLSREPVRMIAAAHRAAQGPWSLPAMNAAGWVLQPEGCMYRSAMVQALAHHGLPLNVTVEAFDQTLLVGLVARGVGFGLAPLGLIAATAGTDRVRALEVPGFALTVSVWLIRSRAAGRIGPVLDVLEDSLAARLGASPAPALHSAAE